MREEEEEEEEEKEGKSFTNISAKGLYFYIRILKRLLFDYRKKKGSTPNGQFKV